ncbi:MAG TPA: glycosyltransferase [Polyangiaceae bacterium]|nr:glycosyltransferase [Polyangiaceae bacterium]
MTNQDAMTPYRGKVDFHLHSYASNVTDYYAANAFAIPESYSEPLALYRTLKARGMTIVTITDHNSIDGVKELLDRGYDDVFISAEMTTTFPEDGCNIHVTVANMTEAQFAEIHRLRKNVYDLIAYVDQEIAGEASAPGGNRLAYFMTHPLMSTQNRPYGREGSLSVDHIERAILLCNCLEVQNGARTKALNQLTLALLRSLDAGTLERLANKHRIEPKGPTPWLKAFVAGSDDHSGINPGQTFTEFSYGASAPTGNDVVDCIRRRETRPGGAHGGPITLAHSVLKLLYDGSKRKAAPGGKQMCIGDAVQTLLNLVFDSGERGPAQQLKLSARIALHQVLAHPALARRARRRTAGTPFERVFEDEVYGLLADASFREALARRQGPNDTDERIFLVVGTLLNRVFARYVGNLREGGELSLVGLIKEVVALVTSNVFFSLPYLMSFVAQSSDCLIARDVRREYSLGDAERLVLVTDTLFDVNGVAATIKRMMREARRRALDFTVVTCLGPDELSEATADPEILGFVDSGRLKIFKSVTELAFPEYDRLKIRFPPFLELLRYLQEAGFTKMQISTPGVIGLSGLLAAKTLQMQTAATYHTSFPEYVENYTRDLSLEALAWKYMIAFYHAVDEVLVPSKFVAKLLHKRGLRNRKLLILDRWVDVDRFHPRHRAPGFWTRFGLTNADELVKFVYVGRVGVEKNLELAARAYRKLHATEPRAHLIVVGDGPYRGELERLLEGVPATFTGFLDREDLCKAYASADAKLFPSTTDTWGNAPLEAQASGLPVIVSSVGGPAELMREDVTGLQVNGRDADELCEAMRRLMDAELRTRLGRQARSFAESRRIDEPFTAIFDSDAYRRRLKARPELASDIIELSPLFGLDVGFDEAKSVA